MQWIMPGLVNADLAALNIPTMDEAAQIYCNVTGTGVPDLNWYFSYNLFRLAGITQGIAGRIRDGTAANARAMESAKRTVPLSKDAWESPRRPARRKDTCRRPRKRAIRPDGVACNREPRVTVELRLRGPPTTTLNRLARIRHRRGEAAIDRDRLAIDVGGFVTGEEQPHRRQLVRLSGALQRIELADLAVGAALLALSKIGLVMPVSISPGHTALMRTPVPDSE